MALFGDGSRQFSSGLAGGELPADVLRDCNVASLLAPGLPKSAQQLEGTRKAGSRAEEGS
jgi:hypothetical protein